jgi:flagellar export protein FliJ
MRSSQRYERIARLARTAENVAAQAYRRAQLETGRCAAQIADLERYRQEYLAGFAGSTASNGYDAQKLRVFVTRIEDAIAQLQSRLAHAERREAQERTVWLERRRRTSTLDDVALRAREGEFVELEKRLQREIDDRPRAAAADS